MSSVRNATPILPVADVPAAASFLQTALGFTLGAQQDGYAYLHHGAGAVRLIQASPNADMDDPARQMSVYLDVEDADAHYFAHKDALDALPKGYFRAPFDQPYGQREFHVIHGPILFFVGHAITSD